MSTKEVTLATMEPVTIFGLGMASNDRTQSGDIPKLSQLYAKQVKIKGVLPFYVLSEHYDPATGAFDLFIAGTVEGQGLQARTLPQGTYAHMTVRPKLGMLWGPAIGEAKRYFYTQWLPASGYGPLGMEYELHTERTLARPAELDLYFAVEKTQP